MTTKKLLHISGGGTNPRVWSRTFQRALAPFGELRIVTDGAHIPEPERAELIRSCDILFTGWGAAPVPAEIAANPGRLKYVCNVTGTLCANIPIEIIRAGIPVTNWGDAPAFEVAEAAVALLLAVLKNLRAHIEEKRAGEWSGANTGAVAISGTLRGLRLGIYGLGFIGRRFCELLLPFGPALRAFDPFAKDWPPSIARAGSLEELFSEVDAVAIHAGLNDQTRGSVTAALLRRLPDHGILINTARGDIIDQEALFAELGSGRLRAGLDVLAGDDKLPAAHPARQWPNVILTGHSAPVALWPVHPDDPEAPLLAMHEICLRNLAHFANGEPLEFVIDEARYRLMT